MIDIPTLQSDRLILRAFTARDQEPYMAMMSNPEVTRFLGDGQPLSPIDAWRQLTMFIGHWELRGFGIWAVEERSTGVLLGRIGCFHPFGWPAFEIGYTLGRHAWGKGYAREGAGMSLAYARDVLKRDEIISIIRPGNAGSVRVAESLGAVKAESIEFYGAPADIYRYSMMARA
jgi:RimJ/RimL family protein N-acetyltransferase